MSDATQKNALPTVDRQGTSDDATKDANSEDSTRAYEVKPLAVLGAMVKSISGPGDGWYAVRANEQLKILKIDHVRTWDGACGMRSEIGVVDVERSEAVIKDGTDHDALAQYLRQFGVTVERRSS